MKILSTADIYKWEQATMSSQNLEPAEAMEGAAGALFQAIQQYIGERQGSFTILCGFGNNGGAGVAVGRMLHSAGHLVRIYLLNHIAYGPEHEINQQRLREVGITIAAFRPQSASEFQGKSVVIDALLGFGLPRPLDDGGK